MGVMASRITGNLIVCSRVCPDCRQQKRVFLRLVCKGNATVTGGPFTWWRHQIETFRFVGPLRGELTGDRWILRTKANDAELWCFLWQSFGWWFETPSRPLWRHCNEISSKVESASMSSLHKLGWIKRSKWLVLEWWTRVGRTTSWNILHYSNSCFRCIAVFLGVLITRHDLIQQPNFLAGLILIWKTITRVIVFQACISSNRGGLMIGGNAHIANPKSRQ